MVCGQIFRIMTWVVARVTPFHHLGHTAQLLCGQSAPAPGQGSEHYLVAFYDKLTADLFYWHSDPHGAWLKVGDGGWGRGVGQREGGRQGWVGRLSEGGHFWRFFLFLFFFHFFAGYGFTRGKIVSKVQFLQRSGGHLSQIWFISVVSGRSGIPKRVKNFGQFCCCWRPRNEPYPLKNHNFWWPP